MSDIRISTKMYQLLKKDHSGMFFEYDIDNDVMNIYRDYFDCDESGIVVSIDNYSGCIRDGDKVFKNHKKQYLDFLKVRADGTTEILRKDNGDKFAWFRIETYYDSENGKKAGRISPLYKDESEKESRDRNKYIDADTGLYTRAYSDEKMDDFIRLDDGSVASSLVLIDIDRFSDINDMYGVKFGDALLAEVADVLRYVFDKDCIIGRCASDVFAILARHKSIEETQERAQQVIECLEEMYCGASKALSLRASIAIVDTNDAPDYFAMNDLGIKVIAYVKSLGGNAVKTYRDASAELGAPVEYLFPRRYAKEIGTDKHSVSQENMVGYAMSLMEDTHDIESSINMLVRRIGSRYGLDRVSVITINWETLDYRMAYQWSRSANDDMSDFYSKISIRDYYKIAASYSDTGLRECGSENANIMQSAIEAAIYNKGRYAGSLRVEVDREYNIWAEDLRDDLPVLANLIGTYLSREESEKTLQLKQFEMDVMSTAIKGGMKIVLDDRDRTILNISDSLCELFGYSTDEFLAVTDGVESNIIYREDMQEVLNQTGTKLIHDADSYTLKYRVRCKDGSLKWVLDYGRRVKDQEGRSVFYTTCTDVTEVEKSAAQIRELYNQSKAAEECTRIALQNTKTAEFYYYPGEHKMVVPPRSREIIGCKKEYNDMPYDFAEEMVSGEMQRRFIRAFNSVSEPGSTAVCEFRVKGRENWLRITLSAMKTEYSSDRIVVGIAEDISDETSAAQERTRIIESISDSYFAMYHIKLNEGTYSAFSQTPGMKALLGNRGDVKKLLDVMGNKFIVEESSREIYNSLISSGSYKKKLNEKHRMESYEYRHNFGDHIGWVRVSFVIVGMKGGELDSLMLTFMDIDEERRIQEEQKKEHTILSLAITGSYDEIHEINLDTDEVFDIKIVDGYAVRKKNSAGYNELSKLLGEKFIHPEELEEYKKVTDRNYIDKTLTPENPEIYMEFRLRKNIGSEEYVWKSFLHRLIPDSPTKAIMQFINDITLRKKEDLETRKALKDAFDMANNANNAKSDFLSKMSHDIRTPMNAIIGMTSIAQSHMDDSERVEDCLKKIDVSSKHLLGLINDVLDMSKIESGKMDLVQEDVKISELVYGIETILRQQMEQKQHSFDIIFNDIAHDDVIGDALRIRQVLVNLLSNSVKYTPDGGRISLTVTEKQSEYNDTAHFEFRVKDNGMGMTKEYLEKLFDPFTRAMDSRTSKIQGTGLGMTITKQIVAMMDGSINVESEVDKGTEFIVTMFFKLPEKKDDAADNDAGELVTEFDGKRILIAEDNEINMEIAVELLSFTGVEIETASDGQIAFEKVKASDDGYYDMVLMDVQMPVMNGYQSTQAIRALGMEYTNKLPIIACTANAFVEDIRDAEAAGMSGHIAKPIEFEQLIKVMNKWLI